MSDTIFDDDRLNVYRLAVEKQFFVASTTERPVAEARLSVGRSVCAPGDDAFPLHRRPSLRGDRTMFLSRTRCSFPRTGRRYSFNMLRRVIATTLLTLLFLLCPAIASAELLVCDNFGPSVLRYNETTGAFEGILIPPGSGGLVTAHGIEIGPDGNIYVARSSGAINRYSPSGAFLGAFTSGSTVLGLTMTFGPDGNLYAAGEYSSSSSIKRFDGTTGAFIDTFVTAGSGGLNFPNGMAFGPDGNFYVSSANSNSVKRYDGTTGAYMGNFATGPTDPRGLVFGPDGNLYISFDGIRRYNGTTGAFIDLFASGGGLDRPYGLDFGPDGNLYVANDGNHPGEILRYNGTTGTFIDVFASGGGLGSPKYFVFTETPIDIEVDIDIKPGSDPNSINLPANGVLPVAIFSTEDFDALEIDDETILFGDPFAIESGDGLPVPPLRSAVEDVDGDGLDDLLLFFSIPEIADFGALDEESVGAMLTGEKFDGAPIVGMDEVRIVPPPPARGRGRN